MTAKVVSITAGGEFKAIAYLIGSQVDFLRGKSQVSFKSTGFVKNYASAKSYYEVSVSEIKFNFSKPGFLEGAKTKTNQRIRTWEDDILRIFSNKYRKQAGGAFEEMDRVYDGLSK